MDELESFVHSKKLLPIRQKALELIIKNNSDNCVSLDEFRKLLHNNRNIRFLVNGDISEYSPVKIQGTVPAIHVTIKPKAFYGSSQVLYVPKNTKTLRFADVNSMFSGVRFGSDVEMEIQDSNEELTQELEIKIVRSLEP